MYFIHSNDNNPPNVYYKYCIVIKNIILDNKNDNFVK